jgi:hypothetical protein
MLLPSCALLTPIGEEKEEEAGERTKEASQATGETQKVYQACLGYAESILLFSNICVAVEIVFAFRLHLLSHHAFVLSNGLLSLEDSLCYCFFFKTLYAI